VLQLCREWLLGIVALVVGRNGWQIGAGNGQVAEGSWVAEGNEGKW
jgi:hypothetical protein